MADVAVNAQGMCLATKEPIPYTECPCGHRHIFLDDRESRLLRTPTKYATLHPKPTQPARPFTDPLPGGDP